MYRILDILYSWLIIPIPEISVSLMTPRFAEGPFMGRKTGPAQTTPADLL